MALLDRGFSGMAATQPLALFASMDTLGATSPGACISASLPRIASDAGASDSEPAAIKPPLRCRLLTIATTNTRLASPVANFQGNTVRRGLLIASKTFSRPVTAGPTVRDAKLADSLRKSAAAAASDPSDW